MTRRDSPADSHSTVWNSMANRKLRKIRDHSSRNLITRLRRTASPYRQHLIRIAASLATVIILYSFLGGEFGFLSLLRMERHRSVLEKEKRELTAEMVDLEIRRDRLTTDSLYIQRLAREKYGFARDGEVIILVPEQAGYQPK